MGIVAMDKIYSHTLLVVFTLYFVSVCAVLPSLSMQSHNTTTVKQSGPAIHIAREKLGQTQFAYFSFRQQRTTQSNTDHHISNFTHFSRYPNSTDPKYGTSTPEISGEKKKKRNILQQLLHCISAAQLFSQWILLQCVEEDLARNVTVVQGQPIRRCDITYARNQGVAVCPMQPATVLVTWVQW